MNNPRLFYSVILKVLALIAVVALLWVFMSSLFVKETNSTATSIHKKTPTVSLNLAGMLKGEIRKIRWQGKEVAVLNRKTPIFFHAKYRTKLPHPSLNSGSRSIKPEYFVYFNKGDSGNCPLFHVDDTFKDVCSSTVFNSAGREKNKQQQGYNIKIPPHKFEAENLIIGQWPKS